MLPKIKQILELIGVGTIMTALTAAAVITFYTSNPLILTKSFLGEKGTSALINIMSSVIAAFIFYLMIDVQKRWRDIKTIGPHVASLANWLKGDCMAICSEMAQIAKIEYQDELNDAYINNLFDKVSPKDQANMVFSDGRKATIMDYMIDRLERTNKFLGDLMSISILLDSEGISHIKEIMHDSYLMQMSFYKNMGKSINNANLSFIASSFIEHCNKVMQLKKWSDEKGFIK